MHRHHDRNLTVRQTSYISLVTQPSLISPRNSKKPCILLLFSACTVNFHYEKQTEIVSVNTQIKGLKLLCLFQTCNFKRRFYSQMFTFETIKQQCKFGENAQRNGRDRINFQDQEKGIRSFDAVGAVIAVALKKTHSNFIFDSSGLRSFYEIICSICVSPLMLWLYCLSRAQ